LGPEEFLLVTVPFTADAAPIDPANDDASTDVALHVGEDSPGVLVDVMANDALGGPTELWGAPAADSPPTYVLLFNDLENPVQPEEIVYGSDALEINSTGPLLIADVGTTTDGGTAESASGGTRVQYTPPATSNALGVGETASDSFEYTVSDGFAAATATVTVTIVGENDAPTAQDASFDTNEDAAINEDLAPQASDPDTNDSLTLSGGTSSALGAAVTVNADGTFIYDPRDSATLQALASGETMEDTFGYTISDDGGGTDTATVTVTVSGVDEPQGGEIIEPVGLDSLADGPAPLAMNLNVGREDAAGINKASAHDAVMAEAAEPQGPQRSLVRWDWLWWYDYEQMRLKKRTSKKDNLAKQAADEFLAARLA
jgi:VCBS repeat-containing protein